MSSPTKRSLALLRKRGLTCWIVEYWNHFAKKRVDLFGCIDIIAIGDGETVAIQTTSYSSVSHRVKKIQESGYLEPMLAAGWRVVVHGWRKDRGGKWIVREVEL